MEHNANIAHYRHLIRRASAILNVTRIGTKHCGRCWPRKLPSKDKKPFDLRLPTQTGAAPLCVMSEARARSRFSSPYGTVLSSLGQAGAADQEACGRSIRVWKPSSS
jgi:hypothetical protein